MITQAYTDALEKALGRVIADMQREAQRQAAEGRAVIAELRAKIVEMESASATTVKAMVAERLASLKDGKDGAQGPQGERGLDGNDGENGRDGKDGEPGKAGERGPQGEPGKDGRDGLDGATGKQGAPGERGLDGKDGLNGADGEPGPQGERGIEGAPGKLPVVKVWTDRIHYDGEVVALSGSTYQALRDTAKSPGISEDWACIASRGDDGRGFVVRGTYAADREYSLHDVVACNSGSFVALKDGAGTCPGPDWQLIAGPGKRGEKGQPGERGLRGEQGAAGASLERWIVEADEYKALPVMSDGSRGPAVELRSLFEQFVHDEAG